MSQNKQEVLESQQKKMLFHRQKCQDALQLIAALVDSSTQKFLPPHENSCCENHIQNNLNDRQKTKLLIQQEKFVSAPTDKNYYSSQQNQLQTTKTQKDNSTGKVSAAKLISGYEQNVVDPFRFVQALKEGRKQY
jgi:hypothetical protein